MGRRRLGSQRDAGGVAFAERGLTSGTAQWCVVHAQAGQNQYVWILSAAAAAYEYQSAGSRVESVNVSLNLVGTEAVSVPFPPRNAVLWPTVGKSSLTWRDLPAYYGASSGGPQLALNDGLLCDYDQTVEFLGRNFRIVRVGVGEIGRAHV